MENGQLLLREYNEMPMFTVEEITRNKYGNLVLPNILLQRANAKNKNGRIYTREILARELERYQKFIQERSAMGELDHVDQTIVSLQKTSHLITEAHWDGDDVRGTVEVLSGTEQGKNLEALVNSRVKIGISSRGVGSVQEINNNTIVQSDFTLICWDVVSDPSTHGAYLLEGTKIGAKLPDKDEMLRRVVKEYFNK